ncbi:MAG: hypothetical protein D6770_11500 [Anaerolineae bacterium]|nr:MAG: hypothetical protein D6770_11500 [Anaerolineae bacterium]
MSRHKKPIPEFQDEDEEREFWATHDSTEYLAWENAKRVRFPDLKPSTRSISLRLPQSMLDEIKNLAHERDVPYQSLIKVFLRERLDEEYRRRKARLMK